MTEAFQTRSVRYWVYSPGGDALFHSGDAAEAMAYAREAKGRTVDLIVETFSRSPIPVDEHV